MTDTLTLAKRWKCLMRHSLPSSYNLTFTCLGFSNPVYCPGKSARQSGLCSGQGFHRHQRLSVPSWEVTCGFPSIFWLSEDMPGAGRWESRISKDICRVCSVFSININIFPFQPNSLYWTESFCILILEVMTIQMSS